MSALVVVVVVSRPLPAAAAACSLPTAMGTSTVTSVNVPASGNYHVWVRLVSPSASKSSVYLQVDSNYCNLSLGGAAVTPGSLTWINYQNGVSSSKLTLNLTSGSHQFILAGKDSGVSVDKVLLLTDANCTPTGDGSNCQTASPTVSPGKSPTPTPTPVVIPPTPPAKPPIVKGTIDLTPPTLLTDTTYTVDGKTQDSSEVNTNDLSDGLHTISVTGIDSNGDKVTYTETVRVNNHPSIWGQLAANKTAVGGGFGLVVLLAVAAWLLRQPLLGMIKRSSPTVHSEAAAEMVPGMPPPGGVFPDLTPPAPHEDKP